MRLRDLCEGGVKVPASLRDLEITSVTCDSREVKPGALFVAVNGECNDGHAFVGDAEKAGAVVIIGEKRKARRTATVAADHGAPSDASKVDIGTSDDLSLRVPYLRVSDSRAALGLFGSRFYGQAHKSLQIVGVTGTKGKTTTAWILDTIFRAAGKLSGMFGTVENRVGDEISVASNTTPSSLELHRHFARLVDKGGTHAVLEVSSHGIAQKRTAGFDLSVGIFTNIAPEHLDYHKTFENYLDTKTQLFRELNSSAFAVLPREEAASTYIKGETPAQVVWYGTDASDGVDQIRMGPDGTTFRWKGREVTTGLWGVHNLLNVLAAMTAAEALGLAPTDIIAGVGATHSPPGRLEEVPHSRDFRVFVDYAHTDGSLDTVLKAVRSVTRGRVITIFGCGGDRDREKRPRMGRVAEQGSDYIVVTSDNPRCEEPNAILDDILGGLERPDDAVFEPDRRAAIALAIRMAKRDDTVLIAGKGHETYQELANSRIHFDDREVAQEFLTEQIGVN